MNNDKMKLSNVKLCCELLKISGLLYSVLFYFENNKEWDKQLFAVSLNVMGLYQIEKESKYLLEIYLTIHGILYIKEIITREELKSILFKMAGDLKRKTKKIVKIYNISGFQLGIYSDSIKG